MLSDFNNDGQTDVLWRQPSSGKNHLGLSAANGAQDHVEYIPARDASWLPSLADFNGGGLMGILWRQDVSGENQVGIGSIDGKQGHDE